MKKTVLTVALFTCSGIFANQSAVTYSLSGGRLGDNLVAYIHAKWIAYKFGLPLLYKPFPFSEQLVMHMHEFHHNPAQLKNLKKNDVTLQKNNFLEFGSTSNCVYTIPYFPESLEEHRAPEYNLETVSNASPRRGQDWPHFAVDWEDQEFQKMIRKMIAPVKPLNLLQPPKDCICVAVHLRRQDDTCPLLDETSAENYKPYQQYMDVNYPLKFPPESYYLEQIALLIKVLRGNKLYFYIFTDDKNPEEIIHKFRAHFTDPSITFDCRKTDNRHDKNVLEDFFSLMQFDCLIRSDSNFSLVASKLANFKIVISPLHHHWEGKKLIIDKVNITCARFKK